MWSLIDPKLARPYFQLVGTASAMQNDIRKASKYSAANLKSLIDFGLKGS